MRFSADTVYDRERLLRFNSFYVAHKRVMWAILIISTLLATAIFVWQATSIGFNSTSTAALAAVVAADVFYVLFNLVIPRFSIKKARTLNARIKFIFFDATFRLEAPALMPNGAPDIFYTSLSKVMQSEKDIYLLLNSKQCFIVDKAGFTLGSADELLDFLAAKGVKIAR